MSQGTATRMGWWARRRARRLAKHNYRQGYKDAPRGLNELPDNIDYLRGRIDWQREPDINWNGPCSSCGASSAECQQVSTMLSSCCRGCNNTDGRSHAREVRPKVVA